MALSSDQLLVFLAVLDHGSFSAAARALGRVPSAVSMAIGQMEADLDLVLFSREGREPRPSDAARALEPRARHIAAQLRQLDADALSLHGGLEQRLTLAVVPELTSEVWSGLLAELAAAYPSLEVEVLATPQADALKMLHDGAADLALVFERDQLDDREGFQEIGRDDQIAVMSAEQARTEPDLRLEDLIDRRQIVVASRGGEDSHPRYVHARQVWRTDSPHAALGMVEAGIGWAFLPKALVAPRISQGHLVEVSFQNISDGTFSLWVDLVWSLERPLGLAAKRLVAMSRERWRKLGETSAFAVPGITRS